MNGSEKLQLLFSPLTIGTMEVKNRLAMAPLGAVFFTMDGALRRELCDLILARARGGVGMIILADAGMGFTLLDHEGDEEQTEKLVAAARELVEEVHAEGVRIGVQIHHSGRQLDFPVPGVEPVAPSPIPWSKRSGVPRELTGPEIEGLIERYARAAVLVKEAGFDFVEVKACHGYLLSSFLSPHSNRRTDAYGGGLEGRAKITLEIIRRIRKVTGGGLLMSCRFNGSDHVEGGVGIEEAKSFARLLVRGGVDFLNVTAGVYGSYPVIVPPYDVPQGCYVHLAEAIKKEVHVPIVAVGRIKDPQMAEEILQAGKADMVAMGRALLADPDFPKKARQGAFTEIRRCIACNQGCQDKITGETTCLVNPAAAREKAMAVTPAARVKKVLVIGGGPAGMEAARVAALRGHRVTLYEKERELGGQWTLAAIPNGKQEFSDLTAYLSGELRRLEVKVHLGRAFTADMIAGEGPDAAVLATGSAPVRPAIPGIESAAVFPAAEILAKGGAPGEEILVLGGNALGLETAAFVAAPGKKVTVVEMMANAGRDLGATVRSHLRRRLSLLKVEVLTSTQVVEIAGRTILLKDGAGREWRREFDTVVVAAGARSIRDLEGPLQEKVREVYIVGDAVQPRNGLLAMREGAEASLKI